MTSPQIPTCRIFGRIVALLELEKAHVATVLQATHESHASCRIKMKMNECMQTCAVSLSQDSAQLYFS